jgi:hypothetical protein
MFVVEFDDILVRAADSTALAILLEDDGVVLGKDLDRVVNLEFQLLAQSFRDQHTAEFVNFADAVSGSHDNSSGDKFDKIFINYY